MADIVLTCPDCGKPTSISEYAEGSTIGGPASGGKTVACHACGNALRIPERPASSGGKLKLRKATGASTTTPTTPTWPGPGAGNGIPVAAMGQPGKLSAARARDLRRVRFSRLLRSLSWLVFIALAATLYLIRFQQALPGVPLATIKLCGLIAIGIVYLIIISMALKDNMFDGLLSLVVPLYPFYYLFFMSSAVFLRALVAALLVGFGLDLIVFLQAVGLTVYQSVNDWIQHV